MTDLSRDIGGLEARMDAHEKRFDKLENSISEGFRGVYSRLEGLTAAENQRKGQLVAWGKILTGATAVAGVWEAAKAFWHR